MEAAVAQLIKTAIIKAGNSPAAFAAVAQRCPAAGMIRLLCFHTIPQADSPSSQMVLPAGLASTPNGTDCGISSGKARCLARSFIKYLCSACCVPGPMPPSHCPVSWLLPCEHFTQCCSGLSLPVLSAGVHTPPSFSVTPSQSPWLFSICSVAFSSSACFSSLVAHEPCSCPIDRALS